MSLNNCIRARSRITRQYRQNSRHVLILQILLFEKLRTARRSMIGRLIRLSAHEDFRNPFSMLTENPTKTLRHHGISISLRQSNMASVGPKVVRQLSFLQKVKNAFQNWYIYACGYRQLGKRFSLSSYVLNKAESWKVWRNSLYPSCTWANSTYMIRSIKSLNLCSALLNVSRKNKFKFLKFEILFQFRLVVICWGPTSNSLNSYEFTHKLN